jgi:hypothetical protein
MFGSWLSIVSSTLGQKRSRVACCVTVNPHSNSNRHIATLWRMDVPLMRYLELQRLLLKTLQQVPLPPPALPKKPKRSVRRTPAPPSLRAFAARLPQLVCNNRPRLIEVSPDLAHCGLGGAGSLLRASLALFRQAAEKSCRPAVVVFASLLAVDGSVHEDEMCVLPLCFFLCPRVTPLVSNLSTCIVITPDGDVAGHHASMQLFLMVHTGLSLMGCIGDDDRADHVKINVATHRPGDASDHGLLLYCTVTRRPLRRRRPAATTHIVVDDTIASSRLVHRSWEHVAPHPVLSPANLQYRCTGCRTLCAIFITVCTGCQAHINDMVSFWMRYTWKTVV